MQNKPLKIKNFEFGPNITYGFFGKNIPGDHVYLERDTRTAQEIASNRDFAMKSVNKNGSNLSITNQIHSNIAIYTDKIQPIGQEIKCDGQTTNKAGIVLGVITADCTPILFADSTNNVIGALHAGWKGARFGIIENTIKKMIETGAILENIKAVIGPTIKQKSYEVGQEYYENFLNETENNKKFFIESEKQDYYKFDLTGYNKNKLKNAGITQIEDIGLDTLAEEDLFYSYRRNTLRAEKYEGKSVLSFITIEYNNV